MAKNTKINLVKNTLTFIGLIMTSFFCSLFLNFKNENENFILFLILFIISFLISYLVDFLFRKKNLKFEYKSNKPFVVYFSFIIILRIFPKLYPSSLFQLTLFFTFIFAAITIKDFYFEKKLNTSKR